MPFSRAPKSQQNVSLTIDSNLEDMGPEDFAALKNGIYTVTMTPPGGGKPAEIRLTLSTPNLDHPLSQTWNRGRTEVTFTFPKGEESTYLYEAAQLLCATSG